ncbi:MAG TPA: TRAP transporter substrate-binding protein DctP [Polyangiaceae bacterium]|nr:TRAP transporter substrate-binding protein DctP [Polyangiaceae bacterium]
MKRTLWSKRADARASDLSKRADARASGLSERADAHASGLSERVNRAKLSKRASALWALAIVGCALAIPSLASVSAAGNTTIRIGSLAPPGSSWDKVFRAWGNSLKQATGGAVQLQFFPGGVAGDERDVIRKMKLGQMDGGSFTSVGLGQVVRATAILQVPGIIETYKQLSYVREQMASDFEGMFQKEGYRLLGWGDVGFARLFSKKPILKPDDYKSVRPWVPREDPFLPELMKLIGANGIPLGIPEVFPALQTGMVDTVPCSALAAVALQWFRYVTHMSKNSEQTIVGATIMREELFKTLAPDYQKALFETSKKAHAALIAQVQSEDAKAYKTLISRGIIEFDPMATPEQQALWKKVNDELIKRMTGKLWSKELLQKVEKTAAATPKS